ncbi:MAG: BON domain-containing protein [Pirellulales bacterium]|nr:BON domain-containing protein [Pirellulales bacterium]
MRRFFTMMAAGTFAMLPLMVLAGNQEVAEKIAKNLRKSGQMSDYQVSVKFQDGTAWLRGHVSNPEQLSTAMKIAFRTRGVSRVVNELSVGPQETDQAVMTTQFIPRAVYRPSGIQTVAAQQALPNRLPVANVPRQMVQATSMNQSMPVVGAPRPMYTAAAQGGVAPVRYDQPCMPNYAWPSYAAYPNYAALTYPKQYSPSAWPYIGPFYPYPQVPLEWRKVTLEWDDGWWFLDFKDEPSCGWHH